MASAQDPGTKVPLQPVFEVLLNSTDWMSSTNYSEWSQYSSPQLRYYLSYSNDSGTVPLYRLYNLSSDHMDSLTPGEGGYTTEGYVGYPWQSQGDGMTQVQRGHNATTNDHALLTPNEPLAGYDPEGFGVFGYPRYNETAYTHTPVLNTLTVGNLSIASDAAAGGAVAQIWYGSVQFVNTHDVGRYCQQAFFSDPDGNGKVPNPTEAGYASTDGSGVNFGSPVIETPYYSGSTQYSSCIPLEWAPDDFGGSLYVPVLWKDVVFSKTATLGDHSLANVIKYTASVTTPTQLTNTYEYPAALYVNSAFNQLSTVDASTGTVTSQTQPGVGVANDRVFGAGGGTGVIWSDASGNCIGVYAADRSSGGSLDNLIALNFDAGNSSSNDSSAFDCFAIYPQFIGTVNSGTTSYTCYIVVGTSVAEAASSMHTLWQDGAR